MRAKRVPPNEQFRLVMECRASGMTDYQWCLENNIKPGTFYNWVKRLRANGNIIPEADKASHTCTKQEIVRLDLSSPAPVIESCQPEPVSFSCTSGSQTVQAATTAVAMELAVAGGILRIPNGTDVKLLEHVIHILRASSC